MYFKIKHLNHIHYLIANYGDAVVVEGVFVVEHVGDVAGDVKVGEHVSDLMILEHNKELDGE